jgi:hypothetical protein
LIVRRQFNLPNADKRFIDKGTELKRLQRGVDEVKPNCELFQESRGRSQNKWQLETKLEEGFKKFAAWYRAADPGQRA